MIILNNNCFFFIYDSNKKEKIRNMDIIMFIVVFAFVIDVNTLMN